MRSAIWGLMLAACGNASSPPSTKGGVSVELASVTLADDCGSSGYRKPPAVQQEPAGKQASQEPDERHADQTKEDAMERRSCPKGVDCSSGRSRGCAQTSMQLSLKADEVATVKVKKVDLLDDAGTQIVELAARLPTKWSAASYTPWDEKLAIGTAQVSYALDQPPWDKLGGRMQAQTKKYQLRVMLEIGGAVQTVEKQSIAPALMEPEVMTLEDLQKRDQRGTVVGG